MYLPQSITPYIKNHIKIAKENSRTDTIRFSCEDKEIVSITSTNSFFAIKNKIKNETIKKIQNYYVKYNNLKIENNIYSFNETDIIEAPAYFETIDNEFLSIIDKTKMIKLDTEQLKFLNGFLTIIIKNKTNTIKMRLDTNGVLKIFELANNDKIIQKYKIKTDNRNLWFHTIINPKYLKTMLFKIDTLQIGVSIKQQNNSKALLIIKSDNTSGVLMPIKI